MTQEYDEFEVDGIGFRLLPLPVLVAEKLAPALTAMLTPALTAFFAEQKSAAELGAALSGLKGSAEQLPMFREAFASRCEVVFGEVEGKTVWTELKGKVLDQTFRRKHSRYFRWLGHCLALEYGDFLAEIGQQLAEAAKENRSTSPNGSPGESGDSPPTPD